MALTKKQQQLRALAIGSSEIGVLAGLSRWSTPIAIYEAKVMGYEQDATLAMDLGVELEEPIARVYAKRQQRFLTRVDTLVDEIRPYAVASCDRAVYLTRETWKKDARAKADLDDLKGAEKLLECKSTTWRMAYEWGKPGTDEVPEYFLAQTNWQMGTTRVPACDIAVLFDRDRYEVYCLTLNHPLFEGLYEIASQFMVDHVLAKVPPPPDASERYAEYLARAFPIAKLGKKEKENLIAPSQEAEDAVLLYAKLKLAVKRIEAHLVLASNRIKKEIGPAHGLISPRFGKITWKATKDGTKFDAKAAYTDVSTLAGLLINRLPTGDERAGLEARLRAIPGTHTKPKPGHRQFHSLWSNEAKLDIAQVGITFDKLAELALAKAPDATKAADADEQSNPEDEEHPDGQAD